MSQQWQLSQNIANKSILLIFILIQEGKIDLDMATKEPPNLLKKRTQNANEFSTWQLVLLEIQTNNVTLFYSSCLWHLCVCSIYLTVTWLQFGSIERIWCKFYDHLNCVSCIMSVCRMLFRNSTVVTTLNANSGAKLRQSGIT